MLSVKQNQGSEIVVDMFDGFLFLVLFNNVHWHNQFVQDNCKMVVQSKMIFTCISFLFCLSGPNHARRQGE